MGSFQPPSFGEAFGLHHALQLTIDTAFRSGAPIFPEALTGTLLAQFPRSGMSDDEVREAIVKAAKAAGVTIRETSAPGALTPPDLLNRPLPEQLSTEAGHLPRSDRMVMRPACRNASLPPRCSEKSSSPIAEKSPARIMRTARRMGISTVAVYSDADSDALHVREADEAVRIGPPPSAESYLKIDAIIEACRATGAEAVHPGYGFLSENPRFATALEEAGIVFIGPTPSAMAAMGDKIRSKELARAAGVSTVPGHVGDHPRRRNRRALRATTSATRCCSKPPPAAAARACGSPARGRGDRGGLSRRASEAKSSFGDDRVFIEKYIEQPRHIEIQVLGDAHGNVVYPRRARMLDPAPPSEGDRGGAEPVSRRGDAAARWARRPWRWPGRSATAPPVRWSSSSTATAISTSWR